MLARSVGRLDWWNIKDEHTEIEWAAQIALYRVDPWGERRQDLRSALHTAYIMQAVSMVEIPADQFSKIVSGLSEYLECDRETDEPIDMDALMKIQTEG